MAALRVSGADPRERHRGVSHHSLTAYGRVALAPAEVVVPELEGELQALGKLVREQAAGLGPPRAGTAWSSVDARAARRAARAPVRLSTMGRGLDDDPAAFLAAAAAGRHAAVLVG